MNFFWLSVLLILASSVHCQELCRYNLEAIEAALNSSGNVEDFIVDCLALNGSYARYISLSVVSDDSADSVRYDFQCVAGGTLIPTISNSFSNTSTPGVNPFCSSCNFAADDPCIERCGELCGSCSVDNTSNCTTCRYLQMKKGEDVKCLNSSSCDMLHFTATETGCACDGYLRLYEDETDEDESDEHETDEHETEYLLPGQSYTYECVSECAEHDQLMEEDGVRICEVCGVEKCIRCNTDGRCEECIHGYEVIGESESEECVTEHEAELRERTEELRELTDDLLHEQEVEEEEREDTELHLRILLPIFCILTAALFIALSVIAHFWYPYIDAEGNKRSKTKPEDDEQPTVWRPRPTIRFR